MVATRSQKQNCLVTGGSGFVGRHLVSQLLGTGKCNVTVFDIRDFGDSRVKGIVGDLQRLEDVIQACAGQDVVFHVATAQYFGGEGSNSKNLMHRVNVLGTQNVIDACALQEVPKLVYTSSASVVFEGKDLVGVDENIPYAAKPMDYYTGTKIEGERRVLAANGSNGTLATCAIRPSGIFGEGDTTFFPTLVAKARQGKLKYYIGNGRNLVEFTYVGNVAQAHIEAAEALDLKSQLAGQAYFITNDDPRFFWEFVGQTLRGFGFPAEQRPHIWLPYYLIMFIALICQYLVAPLVKPFKAIELAFTPSTVTLAVCTRQLSCKKAKEHFQYAPRVSIREAQELCFRGMPALNCNAADKRQN